VKQSINTNVSVGVTAQIFADETNTACYLKMSF